MTTAEFLRQSEFILRILVAGICGSIIGYERKNRNKEAGVRTHAIVALASALMIIVSKYGFSDVGDYDASRVAAQIVSGIGFLGAGIIFVRNNMVNGLTTAAGIWATAGIGMSIGAGLYYVGFVTTGLVVVVQVLMHRGPFLVQEPYHETLFLILKKDEAGMEEIRGVLVQEKIEIVSLVVNRQAEETVELDIDVIFPNGYRRADLITLLAASPSILSVRG